jgi:hypoxia up-regulated 1
LYKGIDFTYTLSREEFETMLLPYTDRLTAPIFQVLEKAGLDIKSVHSLEIIGGVSRIPKVQELIKEKTSLEISTHLNGDESMAHGAAIYAANFSSVIQVKPMWLSDITTRTYIARFSSQTESEWNKEANLFKYGTKLGTAKKLMFSHNQDLVVVIEEIRNGEKVPLCSYDVKGVSEIGQQNITLFFNFVIDYSGIPFLHHAEARYEGIAKPAETGMNETNSTSEGQNSEENTENDEGKKPENEGGDGNENVNNAEVDDTEEKIEETEEKKEKTEEKLEEKKEKNEEKKDKTAENKEETKSSSKAKKTKGKKQSKEKSQATVTLKLHEKEIEEPKMLGSKDVSRIIKRLESFKESEVQAKKLSEAKNDLETYIYYSSDKQEEEGFIKVTSPSERKEIASLITEIKEWMDSEAFETASVYEIRKRKRELESQINEGILREKEHEIREQSVLKALKELGKAEDALNKLNETKPWIPSEETKTAWHKLNETKKWITSKAEEQRRLKEWEPLAFKTSELEAKVNSVQKQVDKLKRMTKPKPKVRSRQKAPDFMNFGEGMDWSKVKMENVKVDGKEYNYDPEKDGKDEKEEQKKQEKDEFSDL